MAIIISGCIICRQIWSVRGTNCHSASASTNRARATVVALTQALRRLQKEQETGGHHGFSPVPFMNLICSMLGMWELFGIYLPDQNVDVILGATIVGDREDAGAHGDLIACLDEPRAQQVVASCCLIRITLQYPKQYKISIIRPSPNLIIIR